MKTIKVTPIQYRKSNKKQYHYGIRIYNRKTNIFTVIDINTLKKVEPPFDYYAALEHSVGNIIFNF